VRERQTSRSHHPGTIQQAKLVRQVPAKTQKDDLAIIVLPIEQPGQLFSAFIAGSQFA
jgi:hypothetical protein